MLYEVVALVCGFVLPRLILKGFGSGYNGIVSSITQFLSAVTLFKISVSGVTRAALYKPLADGDPEGVSSILVATEGFMRKVALIFSGCVLVMACVYPFRVIKEFDWLFTATLVLVLAVSTIIQYYFGVTYQILLEADQRHGVLYIVQIITTVLNTVLAAVLIKAGASIHMVKLGSAVAFSLNPLLIYLYIRKRYTINRKAKPNKDALAQRWDAFGQAAAAFVHNNTDMVILYFFSTVYEVSVYTVYYMVCNGLKTVIKTLTGSIGAAFGNMMAKGEDEAIQRNMDIFEYVCINLSTLCFCVAGIMMLPFVSVYVHDVNDVNYIRPWFSFLMVLGMAFFCYRIPYQAVIEAAGHYKQTRNGALLEAIVNVVISIATVIPFGLIGVAVGTLVANLIRTVNYVGYLHGHLLKRSYWLFIKQMATSLAATVLTYFTARFVGIIHAESFFQFGLNTVFCLLICAAYIVLLSLIFYRKAFFGFFRLLKNTVFGKLKRKK